MKDLPLIEVKEIHPLPDQWREQLDKAVNQDGREISFDKNIEVKNLGPKIQFTSHTHDKLNPLRRVFSICAIAGASSIHSACWYTTF